MSHAEHKEEMDYSTPSKSEIKDNILHPSIDKPKKYDGGNLYKYRGVSEINRLKDRKNPHEIPSLYLSHAAKFNDPYDFRIPNVKKESIKYRQAIMKNFPKVLAGICEIPSDELRGKLQQEIAISLNVSDLTTATLDWDEWCSELCTRVCAIHHFPKEELDGILRGIANYIQRVSEESVESLRDSLRICSFSEVNDSILMWSHYSENHTGICYEYSEEVLSSTDIVTGHSRKLSDSLRQVIYLNDIRDLREQYRKYVDNELTVEEVRQVAVQIALVKADVWAYEKEWRVLVAPKGKLKPHEGFIIPVLPSCIYLGSKISEENKIVVCTVAKELGVPVKQMVLDEYSYSLNAEPVNLSDF